MPHKSYRAESRKDYGEDVPLNQGLCRDQLMLGATMRIADALEKIAQRHTDLMEKLDQMTISRDGWEKDYWQADRRIRALKGVITRMKNQREAP